METNKSRSYNEKSLNKIDFSFLSDVYKISKCYFKKQYIFKDSAIITKKIHHHTFFETHFVVQGNMEYMFDNKTVTLEQGTFILISPEVSHKVISFSKNTIKYSIAFSFENDDQDKLYKALCKHEFIKSETSKNILECLEYSVMEAVQNKEFSSLLINNRIYEIIYTIARIAGLDEQVNQKKINSDDVRLVSAKQYINDNICYPLTCTDVSKYCHLSSKQLSRIFIKSDGISLMEYIHQKKIENAEKLVSENILSLREISEKLGFSNEYYFNSFFKKHVGMSPGEYREATT